MHTVLGGYFECTSCTQVRWFCIPCVCNFESQSNVRGHGYFSNSRNLHTHYIENRLSESISSLHDQFLQDVWVKEKGTTTESNSTNAKIGYSKEEANDDSIVQQVEMADNEYETCAVNNGNICNSPILSETLFFSIDDGEYKVENNFIGESNFIKSSLPERCKKYYNECISYLTNAGCNRIKSTSEDQQETLVHARMNALRMIAYQAFNLNDAPSAVADMYETMVHLIITRLCTMLSPKPLKLVIILVKSLIRKANYGDIFKGTAIPTSWKDWKKYYVGGVKSISRNIPHLSVEKLKDHAVVDVKSAVESILADGTVVIDDYSYIKPNDNSFTKFEKRMKEIGENSCCYVIPLFIFSDGYKTSNTGGFQNRPSSWGAWIGFVIKGYVKRMSSSSRMIALGPGDVKHEEVWKYILEKLLNDVLGRIHIMYYGALGNAVRVQFVIKYFSADLPERHSICQTLSYSSPLHRMFGCIMPIYEDNKRKGFLSYLFHSCPLCMMKRLSAFITTSHHGYLELDPSITKDWFCTKGVCADFELCRAKTNIDLPRNYPTIIHKDSPPLPCERNVGPNITAHGCYKFTLESQRQAMIGAHYNYHNNTWSEEQFDTYMRCCGISTSTRNMLKTDANNAKLPAIYGDNRKEIDRSMFVESIMHHLFEGIHELLVMDVFPPILTKQRQNLPVYRPWNKFILKAKLAKASWLDLYCFAEKSEDGEIGKEKKHSCAGWVGVNHLASCRLLKISFSHVRSQLFPNGDEITNNSNEILNLHILDLMEAIVQTFHSMVSRMMQLNIEENDVFVLREHIKLFLSLLLMLSSVTIPESKAAIRPFTGGNTLGLLNIIPQMMEHGSCRNMWDGDSEKLIQQIKAYLGNRRRTVGYYAARLEKQLRDITLESIMTDLRHIFKYELECDDEIKTQKSTAGSITHTYTSSDIASLNLKKGDGVSGIIVEGDCVVLIKCEGTDDMVECQLLKFNDDKGIVVMSSYFCPISIDTNNTHPRLLPIKNVREYENFVCVAPPQPERGENFGKFQINEETIHRYSMITDEWRERRSDGTINKGFPDHYLLERIKDFLEECIEKNNSENIYYELTSCLE